MLNNKQNKTLIAGYSLVEMMIALVVLAMLMGGALVPLTARYQMEQHNTARDQVEEAKEAVLAYAVHHLTIRRVIEYHNGLNHVIPSGRPYLPCPDIDNDGLEDRIGIELQAVLTLALTVSAGSCKQQKGLLPWKTLGIKDADIWGNRLTYAVDEAFSNRLLGFDETFKADVFDRRKAPSGGALDYNDSKDESGIIICNDFEAASTGGCPDDSYSNIVAGIVVTSNITTELGVVTSFMRNDSAARGIFDGAVFVVLSHGKNGSGAMSRHGRCQGFSGDPSTYYNEQANAYYKATHPLRGTSFCPAVSTATGAPYSENTFVSAPIVYRADDGVDASDDIVVWTGGNELIGYLLNSGSLPIEKLDFLP